MTNTPVSYEKTIASANSHNLSSLPNAEIPAENTHSHKLFPGTPPTVRSDLQTRTDEVIARSRAWRATHMPHTIVTDEPSALCLIALDHARSGYYVHPLAPKDKMPLAGGNGYKDATRDEETIRAWWAKTPNANVGINLARSGIVDIAPDSAEWADRFKANGMPRTMLYTSGGGAGHWHSWYRLPQGGPVARACVKGAYDIMSEGNAVAPGSMHPSGKAYTMHTKLMPVEDLPLAPQWAIDLLQTRVKADRKEDTPEDWAALPDGARMVTARFRALTNANDQLRAVVAGEGVTLTTKDGAQDSSTSIQRSVFVNQLLRAHYPHDEIRALALHFAGVLESDPETYKNDIDRLLTRYTPKDYQPEPTRGIDRFEEPPRGGRHYEITAGAMLDAYQQHADNGILAWTVNEAAERLHVSTGTIKRREAELIAAGQIRRDYGRVVLLEIRSQCIETPQTASNLVNNVNEVEAERTDNVNSLTEVVYENAIGSQFVSPHQDATNPAHENACNERAHVEITHPPHGAPADEWDGIDREIEDWKATTRDGRRFAELAARQERDRAGVERMRALLLGAPSAGACVLSSAPIVPPARAVVAPDPAYRVVASCAHALRHSRRKVQR